MTIGSTVGRVKDVFSVKNDQGDRIQLSVTFDFANASDDEIRGWLVADRRIALQRALRPLSAAEIRTVGGSVIDASMAGRKIQSPREKFMAGVRALRAAGFDASALIMEWNAKHPEDKIE